MRNEKIFRVLILFEVLFLAGLSVICVYKNRKVHCLSTAAAEAGEQAGEFIKWVDFQVSAEALGKAYEYDRDTYGQEVHLNWIELLAYTAAKTGGDFSKESQVNAYLEEAAKELAGALKSCKMAAVLDRCESYNGNGGPLGCEVDAALFRNKISIETVNYIYGLGGRDFTVEDACAVFQEMEDAVCGGTEVEQYQYIGLRK